MLTVEEKNLAQARCPRCGTTRLRRRTRPDRIDQLESSPFNRIQRVFGAQLYHCIYCRYQFYDRRGMASVPAPKVEQPELAQVASSKGLEVSSDPPATKSGIQSHFGRTVRMQGSIAVSEDLYIDGIFKGEVASPKHRVTVGPNARVEANIRARELIVEGHLTGVLQVACRVIVHPAAIVASNIRAGTIAIENGACLRGSVTVEGLNESGIEAEIENLAASIAAPDVENSTAGVGGDFS
jgi:cytoskeletal protein CcmA (bactofilin family)